MFNIVKGVLGFHITQDNVIKALRDGEPQEGTELKCSFEAANDIVLETIQKITKGNVSC